MTSGGSCDYGWSVFYMHKDVPNPCEEYTEISALQGRELSFRITSGGRLVAVKQLSHKYVPIFVTPAL